MSKVVILYSFLLLSCGMPGEQLGKLVNKRAKLKEKIQVHINEGRRIASEEAESAAIIIKIGRAKAKKDLEDAENLAKVSNKNTDK